MTAARLCAAAILAAYTLVGCAPLPSAPVWRWPVNVSARQFQQDRALCRNNSGVRELLVTPSASGGLAGALFDLAAAQNVIGAFDRCMESMGYARS